MGNTFPLSGGGVDAAEGVFDDGLAPAVLRSAAGRRSDERGLSRVRISRKTGYKIFERYKEHRLEALTDRSRRPVRYLENHPSPRNPLGVKGAGEGAIIPVGGLMANAVANALASFGAMPNQLPLSPAGTQAILATHDLPMMQLGWILAVVVELGGGLAILFALFTRPVGLVLAIWCVATALIAHTNFADRNQEIHFLKNVAMMGGFLYVVAFGARAWGLEAWWFGNAAGARVRLVV